MTTDCGRDRNCSVNTKLVDCEDDDVEQYCSLGLDIRYLRRCLDVYALDA